MIEPPDILRARVRIAPFAEATPAVSCGEINAIVGARVSLKLENLQAGGSVKLRGALSALTRLGPDLRRRGVVTTAGGNHALAVAQAARLLDTSALAVLPHDAPPDLVAAVGGLGARVAFRDGPAIGADGRVPLPAAGSPTVVAGLGTVAAELVRDVGRLDVLAVPVGTGALAAGCAAAVPGTRVIGATPEGPASVAGGLVGRGTRRRTGTVTVSDAEIVAAMRLLRDAVGVTVEPAGACALAALCTGRVPVRPTDRVGVVISGGNVTPDRFRRLLDTHPVAVG